jgi:hypothetical protein
MAGDCAVATTYASPVFDQIEISPRDPSGRAPSNAYRWRCSHGIAAVIGGTGA